MKSTLSFLLLLSTAYAHTSSGSQKNRSASTHTYNTFAQALSGKKMSLYEAHKGPFCKWGHIDTSLNLNSQPLSSFATSIDAFQDTESNFNTKLEHKQTIADHHKRFKDVLKYIPSFADVDLTKVNKDRRLQVAELEQKHLSPDQITPLIKALYELRARAQDDEVTAELIGPFKLFARTLDPRSLKTQVKEPTPKKLVTVNLHQEILDIKSSGHPTEQKREFANLNLDRTRTTLNTDLPDGLQLSTWFGAPYQAQIADRIKKNHTTLLSYKEQQELLNKQAETLHKEQALQEKAALTLALMKVIQEARDTEKLNVQETEKYFAAKKTEEIKTTLEALNNLTITYKGGTKIKLRDTESGKHLIKSYKAKLTKLDPASAQAVQAEEAAQITLETSTYEDAESK